MQWSPKSNATVFLSNRQIVSQERYLQQTLTTVSIYYFIQNVLCG